MPLKSTCKNILQMENISAAVTWWKWLTWNLANFVLYNYCCEWFSTVWWNWSSDADTYEPKKEWFGNKDVSVHGVRFLYRDEEEGLLLTEYHNTVRQMTHTTVVCLFVLFCFVFLTQAVLRKVWTTWNASLVIKSVLNCFIGLEFWSTDKKCLNQHSLCQC